MSCTHPVRTERTPACQALFGSGGGAGVEPGAKQTETSALTALNARGGGQIVTRGRRGKKRRIRSVRWRTVSTAEEKFAGREDRSASREGPGPSALINRVLCTRGPEKEAFGDAEGSERRPCCHLGKVQPQPWKDTGWWEAVHLLEMTSRCVSCTSKALSSIAGAGGL